MPEASATPTEPTTPTPNVIPKTQGDPAGRGDPADLNDAGKKAIAAERARADTAEKAAKELAARLDAIEQEKLSDLEKAQKAATDATAKLAEFRRTVDRQQVIIDKGVPKALGDRIKGDTVEEMSADADALLALLHAPTTPLPDPSQGARGNPGPASTADLFAAAFGG